MAAALKYGTIEWEEAFLKSRKAQPEDFRQIINVVNPYRQSDKPFYVIRCKSTGKYMAGNYPGAFRWNFKIESALLYNGVFLDIATAEEWFLKQSEMYGNECKEVEYVPMKWEDPEVIDALKGKTLKLRW